MVELVYTIEDVPMIGWECRNCSEPFNSRLKPDVRFCGACGEETVWVLPDDVLDEYRERLLSCSRGDRLLVALERGAPIRGEVMFVTDNKVRIGGADDRWIDVGELELYQDRQMIGTGDDVHYVANESGDR